MLPIKPLTHEARLAVLKYTDPSLRYEISIRIPSLEYANKKAPIRFQFVQIGDNAFTIDDTIHEIRILSLSDEPGGEDEPNDDIFIEKEGVQVITDHSVSMANLEKTIRSSSCDARIVVVSKAPMKIRDEIRDQLRNLIGIRPTYIQRLSIPTTVGGIAIPKGLKVSIRDLCLQSNSSEVFNKIKPILDPSCLPIENLFIIVNDPEDAAFQNPNIQSAKAIQICLIHEGRYAPAIRKLQSKQIGIYRKEITPQDFLEIVRDWINERKKIGSRFIYQTEDAVKYMELIKKELNARITGASGVRINHALALTVPLADDSELNFQIEWACCHNKRNGEQPNAEELVMEVIKKGSAHQYEY